MNASMPGKGRSSTGEKIIDLHEINFVASLLRFEHQDKCGVFFDVDRFNWVHNDPQQQDHRPVHSKSAGSTNKATPQPAVRLRMIYLLEERTVTFLTRRNIG